MKIVIVGGVAGGMSAATHLRRLVPDAEIIVLERGEHVSFAHCGLPYYIGGTIEHRSALLLQSPEGLHGGFALEVRVRHEVLAIDRAARTVEVRDHQAGVDYTQEWDHLVLSTGASPVLPPVPGAERALTLRDVTDACGPNGGNCVEVSHKVNEHVGVRDSKRRDGSILVSDDGHAAASESRKASRELGKMIKIARGKLEISQDQLGERIGCKQSKIGKLESGYRAMSPKGVEPLIKKLHFHDETESFRRFARVATNVRNDESPGKYPPWFTDYRDLEISATVIHSRTGEHLPGIPHSESYLFPRECVDYFVDNDPPNDIWLRNRFASCHAERVIIDHYKKNRSLPVGRVISDWAMAVNSPWSARNAEVTESFTNWRLIGEVNTSLPVGVEVAYYGTGLGGSAASCQHSSWSWSYPVRVWQANNEVKHTFEFEGEDPPDPSQPSQIAAEKRTCNLMATYTYGCGGPGRWEGFNQTEPVSWPLRCDVVRSAKPNYAKSNDCVFQPARRPVSRSTAARGTDAGAKRDRSRCSRRLISRARATFTPKPRENQPHHSNIQPPHPVTNRREKSGVGGNHSTE